MPQATQRATLSRLQRDGWSRGTRRPLPRALRRQRRHHAPQFGVKVLTYGGVFAPSSGDHDVRSMLAPLECRIALSVGSRRQGKYRPRLRCRLRAPAMAWRLHLGSGPAQNHHPGSEISPAAGRVAKPSVSAAGVTTRGRSAMRFRCGGGSCRYLDGLKPAPNHQPCATVRASASAGNHLCAVPAKDLDLHISAGHQGLLADRADYRYGLPDAKVLRNTGHQPYRLF